jgi:protein involved in polysaccharide export with SLBB domain
VRKPGTYRFEEGLSLKSLILKAEGFADNATGSGIEISRRKRDVEVNKSGSSIVELITVNDNKELSNSSSDILLKAFDIITVKEDPYYKKQISVKITGEVLMPAVYTLQSREERLTSLINRAGGLLYTANISGAKLIRQKKQVVDSSQVKRLLKSVIKDTTQSDNDIVSKNMTEVAINLHYILQNPGSRDDITLEEGDELIIPRINNTVNVQGEVFRPLEIMYENGKNMNDYLSDAGGVTQSGKKGRAFVIYANGSSAKIRKPLGIFRMYPKIEPGSNIFVPEKPKKEGMDAAKAGIFVSAITGLLTAAALIFK